MEVNFVFQVRSFHRFKREVQLSSNAQAVWLELFGLFNEKHFPDSLPVSTTHLSAICDISKDSVIRAEKELISAGLLNTVGTRRGRQHTTFSMIWFGSESMNRNMDDCGKPVDNTVENVDSSCEPDDVCDAHKDANCNAKFDIRFVTHVSTQNATQEYFCAAHDDAKCGTYTNNKQSNGKPKRSQKNAYTLCFNDGWRADARARKATAQNVIDACEDRSVIADGLNDLLCRYMGYGMTPEQELCALNAGNGNALHRLNEAAYRLGIYSRAEEAGSLRVDADTMYGCGGDEEAALAIEARRERNRIFRTCRLLAGISHIQPTDERFMEAKDLFDAMYDMNKPIEEIADRLRMRFMEKGA